MAFAAYLILAKQATVWPRGRSTTKRRIAANIAKLPELLRKCD
jgi:hypothetical protein